MKAACILVIEESDALRTELLTALERAGYTAVGACDFLSGLRAVYEAHPDAVILGKELPAMKEKCPCCAALQVPYLPIIALGSPDRTMEMLEAGVDMYLTRPPDIEELLVRIGALLRRKYSQPRKEARHIIPLEELGFLNDYTVANLRN